MNDTYCDHCDRYAAFCAEFQARETARTRPTRERRRQALRAFREANADKRPPAARPFFRVTSREWYGTG